MQVTSGWHPFTFGLLELLVLAVLLTGCSTPARRGGEFQCDNILESGYLNILTLNLLFSETASKDQRLAILAEFVADNSVDLILLQEVVGGTPTGTENSAEDLRRILAIEHNLKYNLSSAFEIAPPGPLRIENAILSPCEMPFMLVKPLPSAAQIDFRGQVIELGRNALMVRLDIPGFGGIKVYNLHLCDSCSVGAQEEQLDEIIYYINNMEKYVPSDNPIVMGGNLNIDLFREGGQERFLYDKIIAAGLVDAYAKPNGDVDRLCEDPGDPDRHCTVGVSDLNGYDARRVDYIFVKDFGKVLSSWVAFNTAITGEPTVSDHAAVFSRVKLP